MILTQYHRYHKTLRRVLWNIGQGEALRVGFSVSIIRYRILSAIILDCTGVQKTRSLENSCWFVLCYTLWVRGTAGCFFTPHLDEAQSPPHAVMESTRNLTSTAVVGTVNGSSFDDRSIITDVGKAAITKIVFGYGPYVQSLTVYLFLQRFWLSC